MTSPIENVTISTDQLTKFMQIKLPNVKAWRQAGLLPYISDGRGHPAEFRFANILSAWLCSQLIRYGARTSESAQVANHADIIGAFTRAESDEAARLLVPFRDFRPSLSGDPVNDPYLSIPLGPIVRSVVSLLRAEIAAYRGEEAGEAAEAEFWRAVADARKRHHALQTARFESTKNA